MNELFRPSLWRRVLPAFVLSRLWVALWVYAGHFNRPYLKPVAAGYAGVENWWLNPWTLYDSTHFLDIATHGYRMETAPFFPLYPFLLRLAGSNQLAMAAWGIVLSSLALLVALAALHVLTRRDGDERIADLTIWMTAFFPTAAVFSAVYTDSLFFALVTLSFLAARCGRWWPCALFGLGASLTRNSGAVIWVALTVEYLMQNRRAGLQTRKLLLLALPLIGLIAVQLGLSWQLGRLGAGISGHSAYGRSWGAPWMPIWNDLSGLIGGRNFDLVTLLNLSATVAAVLLMVKYWRRQPISHLILVGGILLMQLAYGRTTAPFTNSSLRFLSTSFPFAQMMARALRTLPDNRLRLALASAIYLLICAACSYLFGQKWFVTG